MDTPSSEQKKCFFLNKFVNGFALFDLPNFPVRSLTVRRVTVRSLTVRSLTVRSLTVRSLTVRSLTVRSLTVRSLTARSLPGCLPWVPMVLLVFQIVWPGAFSKGSGTLRGSHGIHWFLHEIPVLGGHPSGTYVE